MSQNSNLNFEEIIRLYQLELHPEGGYKFLQYTVPAGHWFAACIPPQSVNHSTRFFLRRGSIELILKPQKISLIFDFLCVSFNNLFFENLRTTPLGVGHVIPERFLQFGIVKCNAKIHILVSRGLCLFIVSQSIPRFVKKISS